MEEPLYEDSTVIIFGKEYVVFENYHEVEIDEDGSHEKVVCTVVTEEEYDSYISRRIAWKKFYYGYLV